MVAKLLRGENNSFSGNYTGVALQLRRSINQLQLNERMPTP